MGIGDLAGATLALTNVSSSIALVACSVMEDGKQHGETFQLPAHNQRVIALASYLTDSEASGRRVVGLTVSHSGAPGDVIAQGLASIGGQGSYNVHLFDSARLQSSSLVSPVLVLQWAHTPFLALRNTAISASTISLIAHYNAATGQKSQQIVLQKLDLPPNASIFINLQGSLALLPSKAQDVGMEVATSDSQGHPISGHTIADLVLLADEGRQVIQVTPKDPTGDGFPGFSQPWDITGPNKTVIAVTNPSKTAQVGLMLSFHYDGGQYSYPAAMLEPGETRHISVNDVRDQQVPGALGQKMPKAVSSGQALISAPGPHDVLLDESVVADPTQEVALTSSCNTCPANATFYTISPSGTVDGLVGDQTTVTPYCHLDNGTQYQVLNPFAIDWSPGDSSIASVTWNGNTAYLNFVGYGSTTVSSTSNDCVYQYNEAGQCDCTTTPFPVQTPVQARGRQTKWVAVTTDSTTGYSFCPSRTLRDRIYRGLDDFGYIPFRLSWILNETVTSKSSNCGDIGTGGTLTGVNFEDQISIGCSNPSSCVFETDQTFSVAKEGQQPVQVPGKNCVGMQDTQCGQQTAHTGWHVSASATSVGVADK